MNEATRDTLWRAQSDALETMHRELGHALNEFRKITMNIDRDLTNALNRTQALQERHYDMMSAWVMDMAALETSTASGTLVDRDALIEQLAKQSQPST